MLHSIHLTEPDSVLFSLSNSNHGFSGSLNGERLKLIDGAKFHRFELKDRLKPGKNTLSLQSDAPVWAVDAEIEIQSKNSNGIALPAFKLKRSGNDQFKLKLTINLRDV